MQYVTTWERQGIEQGIERSIIDILETRFGMVPAGIVEQIQRHHDHEALRQLLKRAVLVESLDAFAQLMPAGQA